MPERVKTHHTDEKYDGVVVSYILSGPKEKEKDLLMAAEKLGFEEVIPWREAFENYSDEELPGAFLLGARTKEGLTQKQLAERIGAKQVHISEMEHGKRPIGKDMARKLGDALNISYKVFL